MEENKNKNEEIKEEDLNEEAVSEADSKLQSLKRKMQSLAISIFV